MAKELHELNELEERVILVAVEMDERSSRSAMDTDACKNSRRDGGGALCAEKGKDSPRTLPWHREN